MFTSNGLKQIIEKNKEIVVNVLGAFGIRGLSMLLSLFSMPIYIKFFEDKTILGIWYTVLSVLNWVLYFDLGLGNGLRNKLPVCLAENDYKKARHYISSTYGITLIMVIIWTLIGSFVIPRIRWNTILNVTEDLIKSEDLSKVIFIVFVGIMIQFLSKIIVSILYALQKSAIVNLLSFITTAITLMMVSLMPSRDVVTNLKRMACVNIVAVNLPYIIATVFVFKSLLRKTIPKLTLVKKEYIREVLGIGIALLWMQMVFMVISNTNEVLISYLTDATMVVEFQAYNKIYSTIASVLTLALAPIWSAVTKALAEQRYIWIKKMNHLLLTMCIIVFVAELSVTPILQTLINVWLGKEYIVVSEKIAIVFAISNTIFFLHNVNTSMCNGISFFKVQMIWMSIAAFIDIPLAILFVRYLDMGWIGVIVANILALLPFEIIEIFSFERHINTIIDSGENI